MNFTQSLNKGLLAAQDHIRNKQEIEAVFAALSADVMQVTHGKVSLRIKLFKREEKKGKEKAYYLTTFPDIKIQPPYTEYEIEVVREEYITAISEQEAEKKEKLARWQNTNGAYPCFIYFQDREYVCADKESLQAALSEIMEEPLVGEKILSLMNF